MDQSPQQEHTSAYTPSPRGPRSSLGLPIAIVLAAALVAGAIVFNGMQKSGGSQVANVGDTKEQQTPEIKVAPVTDKDHIRGNPNAPVMIIEYSDFDCPFCKNFHETMNKIMAEYGTEGKVAWVYRQFPLEQLHPNAPKVAEASECVASIGGNDAFWKFTDLVFGERGVNEPTNIDKLPDMAERAGADKAQFKECLSSGKFESKVQDSITEGMAAGARGTPYSLLIVGDQQGVINGAQPYMNVKRMIDTVLAGSGAQEGQ